MAARQDRLVPESDDQRTYGERDRDRILYTASLRRLGRVTQVVGPEEGHMFHNRLTHTFEVAQIGRRLAQKLVKEDVPTELDPEIVDAAALAHDLGHPPFGHISEVELDRLLTEEGVADGYELPEHRFPHGELLPDGHRTAVAYNEFCGLFANKGAVHEDTG